MDLKVDKWYKGTADILKSVIFKITTINDNGSVDIVTSKPFEHRMSFGLVDLKDTMKIVELS